MKIGMDVGLWFEIEEINGEIFIVMPCDNNGNSLYLKINKTDRRYFRNLIEEGFCLLTDKEREKVLKHSKKKREDKNTTNGGSQ